MKKFTAIQLFMVCVLLAGFYSCTPKYSAHFTKSSNFYEPDVEKSVVAEGITEQPRSIKPIEVSTAQSEPTPEQYVVSTREILPVAPSPSITRLVEKHKQKVEEIENSGLESKELKRELKREKRLAKREIKREIKAEVKKIKETNASDAYVLMMILAVIIPPLAVGLTYGIVDKFWISLLLTILFFIPGMIYSLIVVNDHFR